MSKEIRMGRRVLSMALTCSMAGMLLASFPYRFSYAASGLGEKTDAVAEESQAAVSDVTPIDAVNQAAGTNADATNGSAAGVDAAVTQNAELAAGEDPAKRDIVDGGSTDAVNASAPTDAVVSSTETTEEADSTEAGFSNAVADPYVAAGPSTIAIDGNIADWTNAVHYPSADSGVISWSAARDGNYLYLLVTGTGDVWNFSFQGKSFNITYPANTNITNNGSFQLAQDKQVHGGWYQGIDGSAVAFTSLSSDDATYSAEFAVPLSYFASPLFDLTYAGTTVSLSNINDATRLAPAKSDATEEEKEEGENDPTEQPDAGAVYQGITIDGSFKDWAAVAKYGPHANGNIVADAMIWDGDMIYLYFREPEGYTGNIEGSTPWGNSNFALRTDLGRESTFFLTKDGVRVAENHEILPGSSLKYAAYQYELAIPTSYLKEYNETISLDIYQGENLISNVANLHPVKAVNTQKGPISFDGDFSDWGAYHQDRTDYTTGGGNGPDGGQALVYQDGLIYGHAVDYEIPDKKGGAANNTITDFHLSLNDTNHIRGIKVIGRNADGSFDYNGMSKLNGDIGAGDYELDLVDEGMWGQYQQDENSDPNTPWLYGTTGASWLGKIHLHIDEDGTCEAEFWLGPEQLVKNHNQYFPDDHLSTQSMQQVNVQFHEIGQTWSSCAGASSGPLGAILIPMSLVGGWAVWKRKKNPDFSILEPEAE